MKPSVVKTIQCDCGLDECLTSIQVLSNGKLLLVEPHIEEVHEFTLGDITFHEGVPVFVRGVSFIDPLLMDKLT